MKKIVFFDVDGTLVSKHNHVSESTRRAVQSLKKEGVLPVIATGRSPLLLKEVAKSLEINTFISMNGQYIVINGKEVFNNPIPKKLVYNLTNYVSQNKDGLILCNDEEIFTNTRFKVSDGSARVRLLKKLTHMVPRWVQMSVVRKAMQTPPNPEKYAEKEIHQGILAAPLGKEVEYAEVFNNLEFTRSNKYMIDVVNKGISKATGVQTVLDYFGVARNESYAFGDHLNDLEMLKYAGIGIAMGNAILEAKEASDIVTDHVKKNGIEKALQKLELIR